MWLLILEYLGDPTRELIKNANSCFLAPKDSDQKVWNDAKSSVLILSNHPQIILFLGYILISTH